MGIHTIGLDKGVHKANLPNDLSELNELVGLRILEVKACKSDYGYDFTMLKTDKTWDDGKPVYLIISQDAELNGGGYVGYANVEKQNSQWELVKFKDKKREF
jgi:hypothetical protein